MILLNVDTKMNQWTVTDERADRIWISVAATLLNMPLKYNQMIAKSLKDMEKPVVGIPWVSIANKNNGDARLVILSN